MQNAARQYIEQVEKYDIYAENEKTLKPELTVEKSKKYMVGVSRLRLLFCATMIVGIVTLCIYNNVAMVELGERIRQQGTQLETLVMEGDRLQAKLQKSMSLNDVAEQASEKLLMGKAEDFQITYLSLNNGDVIKRTQKTPDQHPVSKVMETIRKLQAYMKSH